MVERSETLNSVARAVDVLDLFGHSTGTLGVTEIATELGLAKAVVHRILQAFRAKGYVEVDPVTRRYSLGPNVVVLGLSYLDRLDVRTVAHDALRELSAATNETATLSVRFGDERVYVDQVNPSREVQMVVQLGGRFPLEPEFRSPSPTAGFVSSTDDATSDAVAVAAPVFDRHGSVTAVISVCGPRERFHGRVDAVGARLVDLAKRTSRRLGYR